MMELDRELVRDLGFVIGKGWNHEVWVYEGYFWIHFGRYDEHYLSHPSAIDGETSRKDFLRQFIEAVKSEVSESYQEIPESW